MDESDLERWKRQWRETQFFVVGFCSAMILICILVRFVK